MKTSHLNIARLSLLLCLFLLTGCGNVSTKTATSFDKDSQVLVKEKASEFSNEDYQNGEVKLKTYVKMTGEIVQTDGKDEQHIKKDDRFILRNDGYDYQVINSSDQTFKLHDKVNVYGEYYGFVQGSKIELSN